MSDTRRMDPADVPAEGMPHLEALAFNALSTALAEVDRWMLLTERVKAVEAVLAAVLPEYERQVRERMAEEIEQLANEEDEAEEPGDSGTCRIYDDGEGGSVRVRGDEPLTDEGQAAMRELVGAARRKMAAAKEAERAEIERQVREKVAEEILADVAALFAARVGADLWESAYRAARVARGETS